MSSDSRCVRRLSSHCTLFLAIACVVLVGGCDRDHFFGPGDDSTVVATEDPGGATSTAYSRMDVDTESASEDVPFAINGNTFEDYHYAFSLERPSYEWMLYSDQQAHSVGVGNSLVLQTQSGHAYLEVYVTLVGTQPLEEIRAREVEKVGEESNLPPTVTDLTVGGENAFSIQTISASGDGVVHVRDVFVIHDGFLYNLYGWTVDPVGSKSMQDIAEIQSSLVFLDERTPVVRVDMNAPDATSGTGLIRNNIYRNALTGLKLTPTDKIRLGVPGYDGELPVESGCEMTSPQASWTQTWSAVPVGPVPKSEADLADEWLVEVTGAHPENHVSSQVAIDGVTAIQHLLFKPGEHQANRTDLAITYFVKDGYQWTIESRWSPGLREQGLKRLEESYKCASFMAEEDRLATREEIQEADVNNEVGEEWSLRSQRYTHFGSGLQVTNRSERWIPFCSDVLEPVSSDFRHHLGFSLPGSREVVSVYLELQSPEDVSHEEFHSSQKAAFPGDVHDEVTPLESGQLKFLLTKGGLFGVEGVRNCLLTAEWNGYWIVIRAMYAEPDVGPVKSLVEPLLDSLTFSGTPLPKTTYKEGVWTDHRMGFAVEPPAEWRASALVLSGERSTQSSGVIATDEDRSLKIQAFCLPSDAGIEAELAAEANRNSLGILPWTEAETEVQLQGRSARKLTFEGETRGVETNITIWDVRRGNTHYVIRVVLPKGDKLSADEVVESFRLID